MADALTSPDDSQREDRPFVIHQALHGYSDGHRLLASSIPIPTEPGRVLLQLTDLSGPSLVRGFEEYLTGFPLHGMGAYAFTRTWFAHEMPRPSCVWSHTLILSESVVSRISSLEELQCFFARPTPDDYGAYTRPLTWKAPEPSRRFFNDQETATAAEVLWKLYGPMRGPAALPAANAQQYERLILSIWALAWVELRLRLCFCTGSLSNRTYGRRPFDIQAGPSSAVREISRDLVGVTAEGKRSQPAPYPHWVNVAASELDCTGELSLTSFFRSVSEPDDGREQFASLTELFAQISAGFGNDDVAFVERLLAITQERFPTPTDGLRFKLAVFGVASATPFGRPLDERMLLKALATTSHSRMLSAEIVHPVERGVALFRTEAVRAAALLLELFHSTLNFLGDDILRGLILGLTQESAIDLAHTEPSLIETALRIRPDLATLPQLWDVREPTQRGFLNALAEARDVHPETAAAVVRALLHAGVEMAARPALRLFGRPAVASVLDALDSNENLLPAPWTHALSEFHSDMLAWLSQRQRIEIRTAMLIASLLDPHSPDVLAHGTRIWQNAISSSRQLQDNEQTFQFCMFLLTLALQNVQPSPEGLAAFTFAYVHGKLEHSEPSYDSWQSISRVLPEIGWRFWWDKCERLRRGLLHSFVAFDWPPGELLRCTSSVKSFNALKRSAKHVMGGQALIKKALEVARAQRSVKSIK